MPGVGMDTDYYAILGVDRGAGPDAIRASYRRLMQSGRIHPDLGGDTREAALINKAYTVLSDVELRREYDARLLILERVAQGIDTEAQAAIVEPANACAFCHEPHGFSQYDDLSEVGCQRCGSALQRAGSERMEHLGKRAIERFGRSFSLLLFTRHPQTKGYAARCEDVSLQGIRLSTRSSLEQGQRVRLLSDTFDAVGEVVHCALDSRGWRSSTIAGASFLTLRFRHPSGVFVSRQI